MRGRPPGPTPPKTSTERGNEYRRRLDLASFPALPRELRDRLQRMAKARGQSLRELLSAELTEVAEKLEIKQQNLADQDLMQDSINSELIRLHLPLWCVSSSSFRKLILCFEVKKGDYFDVNGVEILHPKNFVTFLQCLTTDHTNTLQAIRESPRQYAKFHAFVDLDVDTTNNIS